MLSDTVQSTEHKLPFELNKKLIERFLVCKNTN